ncbi:MAG: MBL fold metallo-hydrolase [Candidatus Paceibacterota bacterium]
MIINFAGLQTFKIQFGDTVIAVNPASKESENVKQPVKFGADISLVSVAHPDFNGVENNAKNHKTPFVIDGPGEYEVGGVTVAGFSSPAQYEGRSLNTIYTLTLEQMNLCFLGALSTAEVPSDIFENVGGVDILFVPIAGGSVLEPAEAYKLSVKLEASVIIPCHYTDVKEDRVSEFIKESGEDDNESVEKYTVKKKDIEGKSGEVKILIPSK